MKLRVISTAMLLLVAGSVLADTASPGHDGGKDRMDRMAILLDLNEGQKVEVKKVLDEQFQQIHTAHQQAKESGTRPSREEMRAHHEQMRKDTIEKLRPILSDQQMTKFQALTDHPEGGPHGHFRDKPQQ